MNYSPIPLLFYVIVFLGAACSQEDRLPFKEGDSLALSVLLKSSQIINSGEILITTYPIELPSGTVQNYLVFTDRNSCEIISIIPFNAGRIDSIRGERTLYAREKKGSLDHLLPLGLNSIFDDFTIKHLPWSGRMLGISDKIVDSISYESDTLEMFVRKADDQYFGIYNINILESNDENRELLLSTYQNPDTLQVLMENLRFDREKLKINYTYFVGKTQVEDYIFAKNQDVLTSFFFKVYESSCR